jgi:hypothetical protein
MAAVVRQLRPYPAGTVASHLENDTAAVDLEVAAYCDRHDVDEQRARQVLAEQVRLSLLASRPIGA